MQEYQVTVERTSHKLKRPFLVLATQNPLEYEGTYNLPEAELEQLIFKIVANCPGAAEEVAILKQHGQQVDLDQRLAETDNPVPAGRRGDSRLSRGSCRWRWGPNGFEMSHSQAGILEVECVVERAYLQ